MRKSKNNWFCPLCKETFKTRALLRNHKSTLHYNVDIRKFSEQKFCPYCGHGFWYSHIFSQHKNWCEKNPNRISKKGHSISDSTKKKISKKLSSYYRGSSIWRTQIEKRRSYAEEYFNKCFPDAEQQYHVDKYFLDLAWPEKKAYIEIDGEQHYNDPKVIEHDKIRTSSLAELGWVLITRIRWSDFQKLTKFEKENYIHQVGALVVAHKPHKLDIGSGSIPSPDRTDRGSKFEKLRKERWNLLQNSNIDFSKFGWVAEAAKLFGVAPNKAGIYIKKNYPSFYKNCFIRN